MEGPKSFEAKPQGVKTGESVESLADWRELKERAPEHAEQMIASIDGFEDMTLGEQKEALTELMDELASNNSNRYIGKAIAQQIASIMKMPDAQRAQNGLQPRSPLEKLQLPAASEKVIPFPAVPPDSYLEALGYFPEPSPDGAKVDQEQPSRRAA
jgi:hypothetical protein